MTKTPYKKYTREDQRLLAAWAADCAERTIEFFEQAYPQDERPRKAIDACRAWVRTGIFHMAEIRGASLAAHAAARQARDDGNSAACFAARAAGQAVGTAHVAQHAYGAALYALKALLADDPASAENRLLEEKEWQSQHLPEHLREDIMQRIVIQKQGRQLVVKLHKGDGF